MKRRIVLGALAALSPLAAHAQSKPKSVRLGLVYPGSKEATASRVDAVVSGLRASGLPMQQLEIVARGADGDRARITPLVAEVIDNHVAAIVAFGPAVLQAARAATRDIPIIALDLESDPVAAGYVVNISRPGGNVTGVFLDFPNFATKWIELLRECIPQLARIAVLWDPASGPVQIEAVRKTAGDLKLQVEVLEMRVRDDFDTAFSLANQRGAGAAILLSTPLVFSNVKMVADLALRHRLPAITLFTDFAHAGGLLAYGPNLIDLLRQVGAMTAKVLRGQDVAQLPIELPTKFELILNLKTAKALGLTIPPLILARADEVIE
jgi:putative ABC transport system substrate-binding protein